MKIPRYQNRIWEEDEDDLEDEEIGGEDAGGDPYGIFSLEDAVTARHARNMTLTLTSQKTFQIYDSYGAGGRRLTIQTSGPVDLDFYVTEIIPVPSFSDEGTILKVADEPPTGRRYVTDVEFAMGLQLGTASCDGPYYLLPEGAPDQGRDRDLYLMKVQRFDGVRVDADALEWKESGGRPRPMNVFGLSPAQKKHLLRAGDYKWSNDEERTWHDAAARPLPPDELERILSVV